MAIHTRAFNPKTFLSTVGVGREMMFFHKRQGIFAQGDAADSVFVIQEGSVKLAVKSQSGKEAILEILGNGDYVGKDSVAGQSSRLASASAMTDCTLLRIEKKTMMRTLKQQVKLANQFWEYVLARNIRYQQDIVDQHCYSSEKRLARILLLLAHFDGHAAPETTIPKISHETLAEMVGTTRSRVSAFMNRFRKEELVSYEHKGKSIRIRRTLVAFCSS